MVINKPAFNDWPQGKQRVLFPLDPQCSPEGAVSVIPPDSKIGLAKLCIQTEANSWAK